MGRGAVLLAILLVFSVWGARGAEAAGLRRNHVGGYSASGRICLSDCWGQCFTTMTSSGALQLEPCLKGDYLEYFTSQFFSNHALCAGPCGQFGTSFDWCFINQTTWDYCSAMTRTDIVSEALTDKGEHCAGPCSVSAAGVQLCKTASGVYGPCRYTGRHYIQAYTSARRPCVGPCERGGSGTAFGCLDAAVGRRQLCAMPARVYVHVDDHSASYGSRPDKTVADTTDATDVTEATDITDAIGLTDVTDYTFDSSVTTTENNRRFVYDEDIDNMIQKIKDSLNGID